MKSKVCHVSQGLLAPDSAMRGCDQGILIHTEVADVINIG